MIDDWTHGKLVFVVPKYNNNFGLARRTLYRLHLAAQFAGGWWFTWFSTIPSSWWTLMHFSILHIEGCAHDLCTNITAETPVRLTSRKPWRWWAVVVGWFVFNNNVWVEDSREQVSCFDYIIMITMEVRETIFCVHSENVLPGHSFSNLLTI